jgi:hypothetical protein
VECGGEFWPKHNFAVMHFFKTTTTNKPIAAHPKGQAMGLSYPALTIKSSAKYFEKKC